ncbi:MAG TPA: sn-glycerol-3-phosphate ABC transporter substrate-binding protein UgpB [Burkholderiales bacterium]|jgi:sn-glycerol 3-phosphate transport system substrate-binding protein|nr:sn-glycerol-3-phosphate ABC transporter substrate-binding protein UgpB [Burkholderiales bacterium]
MLRILLVALGVALTCGARAATEIELWHAMRGPAGAELDALVRRFNASQREVRMKAVYQGGYDQTYSRALAAHFERKGPHLVQVVEAGNASLMAWRGAVKPAWEVLAEAGVKLNTADLVPAVASYFSDGSGRLLALPFNAATPILYYNKEAFRRSGLDPEKPPRTWYEMVRTLGTLIDSGMACGYATAWPAWVLLENMSLWHNQEFATNGNGVGGADARFAFNTHVMMRFIAMLSSWSKAGYFTYTGRGEEAEARFAAGECAVLTTSSAAQERIARDAKFAIGASHLPYYDDVPGAPQNTVPGGAGLWAFGGKKPAEYRAVAKFFSFLLQAGEQARWHQRTGYLPVTRQAYELSRKAGYYRERPGQEIALRQLVAAPTRDSRGIRLGDYRWIRAILDEELEAVWAQARTPKDALDRAVERGNEMLQRFESSNRAAR